MSQISTLRTGLIFGTDTGNTEEMGGKISAVLATYGCEVSMHNIAEAVPEIFESYEFLILGIPTWDFGGIQSEWEDFEQQLQTLDLKGTTVALYGLGDQFGYADYFVDAMGWLNERILKTGARVIGAWSTEGYDFEASEAVNKDKTLFCGLALDEDQQFDLSDDRINAWVEQLVVELEEARAA
ncbi:flavodoxin [Endozoicomonadaceae bacterium StTr2]